MSLSTYKSWLKMLSVLKFCASDSFTRNAGEAINEAQQSLKLLLVLYTTSHCHGLS